jgi:hypothetical protein
MEPMTVYDDLLVDAIDLHCHVDIEFSENRFRKREPEWEWLPKAEAAGMTGFVMKSHLWPTTAILPFLSQLYSGPVQVWGSVTLNVSSGGVDLWSVEAAAEMGARVVFLPTWSSRNDRERGGFHRRLDAAFDTFDPDRLCSQRVLDDDGKLLGVARELVRFCRDRGLTLGTGHLSWQESVALAEEANAVGFDRLLFSHPLSGSVGAPLEAMQRVAGLGGFIEICWPNVAPGRHDPERVVEQIRRVGLDRVVVASDYFAGNCPPPPDLLRLLIGCLYDAGLGVEEARRLTVANPRRVLGL